MVKVSRVMFLDFRAKVAAGLVFFFQMFRFYGFGCSGMKVLGSVGFSCFWL